MSQESLIKIYKFSGVLGLVFIFGSFVAEINFLHIRKDDELSIFGLLGAIVFFSIFFIVLARKIYLYGGKLVEKVVLILVIPILIFVVFNLLLYFSLNINMIQKERCFFHRCRCLKKSPQKRSETIQTKTIKGFVNVETRTEGNTLKAVYQFNFNL